MSRGGRLHATHATLSAQPSGPTPTPRTGTPTAAGLALLITRHRQGIHQKALAARFGLTGQQLSRLERGREQPRVDIAARVADALGIEHADWLRPDDNESLFEVLGKVERHLTDRALEE